MPKGNGQAIPQVNVNLQIPSTSELINTLKHRFQSQPQRHPHIYWAEVEAKLLAQPQKLASINAMESTGGEPDVINFNPSSSKIIFVDCSLQSPRRRSICYDQVGEQKRIDKGVKPGGNAVELAQAMGIKLLNQDEYRHLQTMGEFDTTTSSWIDTPAEIRQLGGALFCDRRYNTVFVYHNSAESFYSARGFRGLLEI